MAHHPGPQRALPQDSDEAVGALEAALNPMPASARLPYLLRAVKHPSPGIRYAAVDALSRYHTPESAAAIEGAFRDSASVVRQRAVETLHSVDRERGTLLLLAALRDEDSWIRETAATQLSMRESKAGRVPGKTAADRPRTGNARPTPPASAPIADRKSVPALVRALDDPDNVVVRHAVGMLHRITGEGAVYLARDGSAVRARVIADWKRWWAQSAPQYRTTPEFADARPIRPERIDTAPAFEISDIDGRRLSLAALHGRLTLLNFWGTWCPPCRVEAPDLERLHEKYEPRGLTIIGAAVGVVSGESGLRKWSAQNGLTYRQALSTPELQAAYGDVTEVPVSVLIDRQGRIRYRWDGERDFRTFDAAVSRLLAE